MDFQIVKMSVINGLASDDDWGDNENRYTTSIDLQLWKKKQESWKWL
ncbi:hypothetical protein [Wolbachia pipientis]|nr:hypothetical protein [Wolbachia pipientis]MDM8335445.1 hypothetical protein [Wolbachia pipientis]